MGLYKMRSAKDSLMSPIAVLAHRCGMTPNVLTALGLLFGLACGVMLASRIAFAPYFCVASIFCDVLDGTLARKFQLESRFGLIFDSVADRITEAAVVFGALFCGVIQPMGVIAIIGSVSLLLLRTLSYRKGFDTNYALFGRGERVVLIVTGLFLPNIELSTLCFVAAGVLGLVSSIQIANALLRNSPNRLR